MGFGGIVEDATIHRNQHPNYHRSPRRRTFYAIICRPTQRNTAISASFIIALDSKTFPWLLNAKLLLLYNKTTIIRPAPFRKCTKHAIFNSKVHTNKTDTNSINVKIFSFWKLFAILPFYFHLSNNLIKCKLKFSYDVLLKTCHRSIPNITFFFSCRFVAAPISRVISYTIYYNIL